MDQEGQLSQTMGVTKNIRSIYQAKDVSTNVS